MAKGKKSVFFCQNCGHEENKWLGQCPMCKEWNTFVEEAVSVTKSSTVKLSKEAEIVSLKDIETNNEERILTRINELDRVLGGGIVPGSLVLVGGDPGIGKSTLLLQVCQKLCEDKKQLLYISGEESLKQIKLRANRMGEFKEELYLLCETNLEVIRSVIEKRKPDIVVIDSIQTMYSEEVASALGSVSQVRESTNVFMQLAKGLGISIFIVGHVTKEGTVAGPRVLEHMVYTVLYFEGDRHASYRILRGVKNRFGSTNEIGMFEMTQLGLSEVQNPSAALRSGRPENANGSCVVATLEGTRPILAEIQGLVTKSAYGSARRTAAGIDYNRAVLLLAILEKRAGMLLGAYDTYINVVGGMDLGEPAVDLAILLAIASSYLERSIPQDLAAFGEVGLSGEVRAVTGAAQRIAELQRLGFRTCIVPEDNMPTLCQTEGVRLIPVKDVQNAIRQCFDA